MFIDKTVSKACGLNSVQKVSDRAGLHRTKLQSYHISLAFLPNAVESIAQVQYLRTLGM